MKSFFANKSLVKSAICSKIVAELIVWHFKVPWMYRMFLYTFCVNTYLVAISKLHQTNLVPGTFYSFYRLCRCVSQWTKGYNIIYCWCIWGLLRPFSFCNSWSMKNSCKSLWGLWRNFLFSNNNSTMHVFSFLLHLANYAAKYVDCRKLDWTEVQMWRWRAFVQISKIGNL